MNGILKTLHELFYNKEGPERVGFILNSGKQQIIEVVNIADDPTNGFMVSPEDVIKYSEHPDTLSTWHTHPNQSSNLSGADFQTFCSFPHLTHIILGSDGGRAYRWNEEKEALLEVTNEV